MSARTLSLLAVIACLGIAACEGDTPYDASPEPSPGQSTISGPEATPSVSSPEQYTSHIDPAG